VILLDTCVVSETVRPRPDPGVLRWLEARRGSGLFVSVLTLGELRKGVDLLPDGARRDALAAWIVRFGTDFADRTLPVDARIASRWGAVTAAAARGGRVVSVIDGLVAATALEHGLTVATRNVTDFAPTGAAVVDPWSPGP
jgi:toxin FitB